MTGKTVQIFLGSILVVTLAVFAIFKTHDLLWGASIKIDRPENGTTLSEAFVVIKGQAPGSVLLTIGGAKVLTDEQGAFEKELLLGLGYNSITIESLDRFNRASRERLELIYRPGKATSSVAINSH